MRKRWKALDELDCVKRFGWNHKVAHFIGTNALSKCFMAFGELWIESIKKSFRG